MKKILSIRKNAGIITCSGESTALYFGHNFLVERGNESNFKQSNYNYINA